MPPESTLLSGWGRTNPTATEILHPSTTEEITLLLKERGAHLGHAVVGDPRSYCIARGLGRSYGDSAQSAGGAVLEMGAFTDIGPIDPATGAVRVGAGVSLDDLLARCMPQGWFLPVTPGTRHVSIGGAIAADVHGKNHHVDGSFGQHVVAMTVATPTGVAEISPQSDPELFWATAGGMGLTGVVTEATVRLIPVETSRMSVTTQRCRDLETVMSAMEDTDADHRYSVAWIDTMTAGRAMGRSVLTQGDHAEVDALPPGDRSQPLGPFPRARLGVPITEPPKVLHRNSVRVFNEVWYRAAPKHPTTTLETMSSFFYPLDGVRRWNVLYGHTGFVQYQFCVGAEHGAVVQRALSLLTSRRVPSFLSVLKRFGPASKGPLSFPVPGWTLALDLPLGSPVLQATLTEIDDLVAECGGRVYLAKDARLSAAHAAVMYPRLAEFEAVRQRVDPHGVLGSDQSRRLGLSGHAPT